MATKRFSSLIAAHDDVVKKFWRKDSGTTDHGGSGIKNARCVEIVVIVMLVGRSSHHVVAASHPQPPYSVHFLRLINLLRGSDLVPLATRRCAI